MRLLKWIVAVSITLVCALGGVVVLGTYDELTSTLPPIERLLQYEPPVTTRVFAGDGSLVEEFFRERRYLVPIEKIPPVVRNAFLAAEDADFYSHSGVDFLGIGRAFIANMSAGSVVQGGSTITQQVVKALLLTPERSYERKLKEILLALRLEQHLTKDQILELYLNQIYFGEGNHGVGAASKSYFDKTVAELTPAEAALLAGLPAAPSRYSPAKNPEAALKRQRYVLRRMVEENFLNGGDYQNALRQQIVLASHEEKRKVERNYYTEAVRLQLEEMFGEDAPYNQGYTVHTAMNPRLQLLAEAAVRNGIERVDSALGYRGPVGHLEEAQMQQRISANDADASLTTLDRERIYQAVVTAVAPGKLDVALGSNRSRIDVSGISWNGSVKGRTFSVGDVIEVRTRKPGESKPRSALRDPAPQDDAPAVPLFLAQTPQIEAALVAIDVTEGGVAAMVGGYDFLSTQFNRAVQAKRQPGSAFKPFIYAAGLDHGYTAASILTDSPVEYMDNGKPWQPRNYTRDYRGPIRFRTALEQSRNVVSVKLVDSVGVDTVVDYLDRFHFDADIGANLSLALGTSEMSLMDLTAGYTAFAGGGIKVEPVTVKRVEDKDGTVFFDAKARRREVLSPQTAALMTYILEGVVERGTGTGVKALGRPVAGKTGTTNEQRDAWFVGYTPDLVVGVWIGFDDQGKSMGKMGTGGRVAAPIWLEFMKGATEGQPVKDFELPDGIHCVNIDTASGARASESTPNAFLECFKVGTEPAEKRTWVRSEREERGPAILEPGGDLADDSRDVDSDPRFREPIDDGDTDRYRVPLDREEDGTYRIDPDTDDEAYDGPDDQEPDVRYVRPSDPRMDGRYRVPPPTAPSAGADVRYPPPAYRPSGRVPPPPMPPPDDDYQARREPEDRYGAPPVNRYPAPPAPPAVGRYSPSEEPPDRYTGPDDRDEVQLPAHRYAAPADDDDDVRLPSHRSPAPSADRYAAPSPDRYRVPSPADRQTAPPSDRYRTPAPSNRYAAPSAPADRPSVPSRPDSYRPPAPSGAPAPGGLPARRPPVEERYMAPRHPSTAERERMLAEPLREERRPPPPMKGAAPPPAARTPGPRFYSPPGTLPEQRPPKPTSPPPGVRPGPSSSQSGTMAPRRAPAPSSEEGRAAQGVTPYPTRPPPPRPPDDPMQ